VGGGGGGSGASDVCIATGGAGGGGGGSSYAAVPGAVFSTGVQSDNGQVTISYTAPTASITTPADGATYAVGQQVSSSFTCADVVGGPGIASCVDQNGTASGKPVDTSTAGAHTFTVTATNNDGLAGTTSVGYMVAAAPSVNISSPASGGAYTVGQQVATSFSCSEGTGGPGISICTDSSNSTSPGALDTSTLGSHTYTVTATSKDGQTGTATITYTVAAAPTAKISSPASGGVYALGEGVMTSFGCSEGTDGTGISTCTDSNGSTSPGALDTSTLGSHTYTVTATSKDGLSGSASITYTVGGPPPLPTVSPASGGVYAVGQRVATSFSCAEGIDGVGISICTDSNGSNSPGVLDTSSVGSHTYTVTAISKDGDGSWTSIHYTVAAAPTAKISSLASGGVYVVGQHVVTSFSCAEGADGPGISTCTDTNQSTSPGSLDTSTPGSHTYTVTATSKDGQTDTTKITYTVAAAPTAKISSPVSGGVYAVNQQVATGFSCSEGTDGPGISTCADSNHSASPGTLDTSTPGSHTYTVTATSKDGQTATASISYTVAAPPTLTVATPPTVTVAPPTATISSPANGASYTAGQVLNAGYGCQEGTGGPGISSCAAAVADGMPIDTTTPGHYTFTVTVTSSDGQHSTSTVSYAVKPSNQLVVSHIQTHPNGTITFQARVPARGRIDVLDTAWDDNLARIASVLQPAAHRFASGRAHTTATHAGVIDLKVALNATGNRLVRHHRYAVVLRLWVTYTPTGGSQHSVGFYGLHLPR
jgi:hypothetical protein